MHFKILALPALALFATGAFAAEPAKTAAPLDALIPRLSAPIDKDSLATQMEFEKLVANAGRPGAEAERAALAAALCAKASDTKILPTVRFQLLRQIAHIGNTESVEPLSKLLADPDVQIREYARMALVKNGSPKAGAVLLEEFKKGGDTSWQTGLINGLGERRESAAVDALAAKIKSPELLEAAISALGKIANPTAVDVLQKALSTHPTAGDALIVAARRLVDGKDEGKAAAICASLYAGNATPQLRSAALNVLALADAAQAKKILPSALGSNDIRLQTAAVSIALKVYSGKEATAFLAPQLAKLSPAAKGGALQALDASAEKEVIALVNDADPAVQGVALDALGRIGSAASVPVLLGLAGEKALKEQSPLGLALATLHGPGAEEAVQKAAATGDPNIRVTAITVLGWRKSRSAAPALVTYAAEQDATISRAACASLKIVGTDAEILPLVKLVQGGKAPNAASAVRVMAARSAKRHALASEILAMAKGSTGQELVRVLDLLCLVGGADAMATVIGYTRSSDPALAEGAVRSLCNWPEFDAVAPLLTLGADPKIPEATRILAVRSVERILLASSETPPAQRVAAAQKMLQTAWRDEEKGLAISVLGAIPDPAAANALLPLFDDEKLRPLVCQAGINLAEALSTKNQSNKNRSTATKLAEAVEKAQPEGDLAKRAKKILTPASRK